MKCIFANGNECEILTSYSGMVDDIFYMAFVFETTNLADSVRKMKDVITPESVSEITVVTDLISRTLEFDTLLFIAGNISSDGELVTVKLAQRGIIEPW